MEKPKNHPEATLFGPEVRCHRRFSGGFTVTRKSLFFAFVGTCTFVPVFAASPKPIVASDVQCADCVGETDIAADAIGPFEIQQDAVGSSEIAPRSVGESELAQTVVDRLAAIEEMLAAKTHGVRVTASGEPIGTYLDSGLASAGIAQQERAVYLTLTDSGYVAPVIVVSHASFAGSLYEAGRLVSFDLLYETAGCIGPAFLPVATNGHMNGILGAPLVPQDGIVVGTGDGYRYVPKGSSAVNRYFNAQRFTDGACSAFGGTRDAVLTISNDTGLTGVPDEPFAAPITLDR